MSEIVTFHRVQTRASVPETPLREKWTPRQTVLLVLASSLGLWAAIIGGLRLMLG